jgi:hypothetical protein
MACFTVTAATAIGVAVARHIVKHNEKKENIVVDPIDPMKTSKKLGILELGLFGGSFILAGEHVLHGEVTFTFPFLTAIKEGSDAVKTMLFEMGTVGVAMTVAIVATWGIALLIRRLVLKKRKEKVLVE